MRVASEEEAQDRIRSELEMHFEQVAAILRDLDIEAVWMVAEDRERRILIEELVEWVINFPDHLQLKVTAAPAPNPLCGEVGLRSRILLVSEGRIPRNPTGGFSPGARDDRPSRVRFL
jgi:hypothetical protein